MNSKLTDDSCSRYQAPNAYEKPCLVEIYSCDVAHGNTTDDPVVEQIVDENALGE